MGDIKYMLKPDWVSWESIHDCIKRANETNLNNDVSLFSSTLSVSELKDYLKDSYVFVAVLNDNIIGMNSLKIINSHLWWAKGDVGFECLTAIDPTYRNTGAYFGLRKVRTNFARSLGVKIMQFSTNIDNKNVQTINAKLGFKQVRYYASSKTWYYSVIMVRWLDGCPYSNRYCDFRFKLSKFSTKIVWRPGRICRLWPISNSDYKKISEKYQLCSDFMSIEEFCQKTEINYNRFNKWKENHHL